MPPPNNINRKRPKKMEKGTVLFCRMLCLKKNDNKSIPFFGCVPEFFQLLGDESEETISI